MMLSQMDRLLFASFLGFSLLIGCSNANFSGSSRSNNPSSTNPSHGPTPTDIPTITNKNPPTNPGFQIPQIGQTPTQPQAPNSAFPNNPLNPPKVIPDPSIIINNPDQVIFGPAPRAFHIGDNNFDASSCKERLQVEALMGTKYFFEFQVMSESAIVSLQITEICGVDNVTTNFVTIGNSTMGNVAQMPLLPSHNGGQFGIQNVALKQGYYAIVVDSLPNKGTEATAKNDRDDFIVGNIILNTNGAQVRGVRVGTF